MFHYKFLASKINAVKVCGLNKRITAQTEPHRIFHNKVTEMPLYFFKIALSILFLLSLNTATFAETQPDETGMPYKEFSRIMKNNTEYCSIEGGVIENEQIGNDCTSSCRAFAPIQNAPGEGNIPSGNPGDALRLALANCVKSYNEVKRLVEAQRAANPSISEVLGLKHLQYKDEVDNGFKQCKENAIRTPNRFSEEKCLCTATHIVSTINENGAYPRVHAAFVRLVPGCRG